MAEKRSNVENFDRVDPSESTLEAMDNSDVLDERDRSADLELADGASEDDSSAETEQIKSQIEETRNQLGETIDAIQDRLSFSNISEQVSEHVNNAVESAKSAVYDATIGKAATIMKTISSEVSNSSIVRTAARNPFPFILIGLGAGLLAYQTYSGSGRRVQGRRRLASMGGEDYQRELEARNEPGTLDALGNKVSDLTGTVSDAAGSAYDRVSTAVGGAYSSAGDVVGKAYGKVGDLTAVASDKYDYYIEENPLAVGAVALALGAAVGFAIPASSFESRVMGPAREQLMGKAQDTASDLIDKTKNAVLEAGSTISEQITSKTDH